MRAQYLGSTALTVRTRCQCGRKADFNKYYWQRRSYVICDQCKSFILYTSLEIKDSSWKGYLSVAREMDAGELCALKNIEDVMRAFVERFKCNPLWHWAPATVQVVRDIEEQLRQLDRLRGQTVSLAA